MVYFVGCGGHGFYWDGRDGSGPLLVNCTLTEGTVRHVQTQPYELSNPGQ